MLRSELGAEVDELFVSFDREPLAAASIAQVHAATLRSGDRVAVKVRLPEISQIVERDLDIAGRLAARLERSTSWGRAVGAAGLAQGFATALREELDLRVEERNMTTVAAASGISAASGVRIPVPCQPLCTQRVLVMERLDGRPLAAIDADPHPGNVLLLADGQLGLLDFGSVGRIVSDHHLAVPPEIAAVFRALATMEGTLTSSLPASTSSPRPAASPPCSSPPSSVPTCCARPQPTS